MSSTGFEPADSSAGRRLYIQIRYSVFYMHQYKQSCRSRTHCSTFKTAYTDACKTHYTIPAYTTVFLQMNPRVRNL